MTTKIYCWKCKEKKTVEIRRSQKSNQVRGTGFLMVVCPDCGPIGKVVAQDVDKILKRGFLDEGQIYDAEKQTNSQH